MIRRLGVATGIALGSALALTTSVFADDPPIITDDKQALAISQAALGRLVRDGRYVGSDGRAVSLSQFRGKPLVINLIYTGCNQSCPVVIATLRQNMRIAQDALGTDSFTTITVGFDTGRDTPERMRAFARERGAVRPNWHFLSTDRSTVNRLAADTGFVFSGFSWRLRPRHPDDDRR